MTQAMNDWLPIESAPRDGTEFKARTRRASLYDDAKSGYVYFDDRTREFLWCRTGKPADVAEWLRSDAAMSRDGGGS